MERLKADDRVDLLYAKEVLESPSLAARLSSVVGEPIEKSLARLPPGWQARIERATGRALERAAEFALTTLGDRPFSSSHDFLHKTAAATSGALGGAGGLALLGVELPLSTVIMLRSIAAIARSEGHSLADPEVRLACLEVFAFGGASDRDDAAETGYFAVRAAMASEVTAAARHLAEHGMIEKGAPALVRLISKIGARFGVAVSEKVAAQAVPVIGAVGGMTVNTLFMDHFQKMAYGHFIIRRLEQRYGAEVVRDAYRAAGE